MLQPLRKTFSVEDHPDLLVGLAAADDAAVYRLNDSQALVATIDFFPPVVDDPYDFGSIAAANALSDVYAMGGRPLFAMNLVAFPANLGLETLREILQGGAEKVAEAGAVIAGGHSITDQEPKYGLSVTGIVSLKEIKTKGGSRPGDKLVLTKPLGTGVITTALKQQKATDNHVATAVASMKSLNKAAAEAAHSAGVVSMTDITGFGLLGHAHEMAHLGEVDFRFYSDRLAWLPGARDYGAAGTFPGGMVSNLNYFSSWVTFADGVSQVVRDLLWTPETSGGLLAAVRPESVARFSELYPTAAVVGEVFAGSGHIEVVAGI